MPQQANKTFSALPFQMFPFSNERVNPVSSPVATQGVMSCTKIFIRYRPDRQLCTIFEAVNASLRSTA